MQSVTPSREVIDIVKEEGGDVLKLCYQCGVCSATCPWNLVRSFIVRRLIHQAQLGLTDFEDEEVWLCVGCRLCVQRCPRGVEVTDIMRALRRVIVEVGAGKVPDPLRLAVKNISAVGNPLGEPQEKRTDWAKDLGVKTYTKGTEILYFPCCYQVYDPSIQRVARATVNILKKADVDFGILGAEQTCCGESIRKAGNESLFQRLAQNNINVFTEAGVSKILVTSPHCYHSFTGEYPELGGNFEVIHLSQYLAGLIKEGRLKLTKELNKRVTYHDSCCLGRYAGIYDEPRQVLESIPGLELADMRDYREYALCCGGCAGKLWMETKKGERFSDLRIEQALDIGASILAVACPYCMVNFEDSVLTSDKGDVIEIRDIAELVQEAI
ncbi:putative iron-sulfur-binding oxidoreductase FadF [subsurface metagenome]